MKVIAFALIVSLLVNLSFAVAVMVENHSTDYIVFIILYNLLLVVATISSIIGKKEKRFFTSGFT